MQPGVVQSYASKRREKWSYRDPMAAPTSALSRQILNSAFIDAAADTSDSRCDVVIGAEGEVNKSVDTDLQIK